MERVRAKYYVPVIIWAAIMMFFSSIPNLGPLPINFTFFDKIQHFGEYSILGFFFAFALVKTRSRPRLLVALLICAAYGIFDELHQLFIPGRFCDPLDATADIIGSAAGLWFYSLLKDRISYLSYRRAPSGNIK